MLTPYPYQLVGRDFLLEKPKALRGKPHRYLGDDMGLGKTVQALIAIKKLRPRKTLIVCPATVKYNWSRKIIEWGLSKGDDIFIVQTGKDAIPDNAKYVIINYDLLIKPAIRDQLINHIYGVGVFDEAHRLRNHASKRTKEILGKKGVVHCCHRKFLLSGTPIPNRIIDIFWILYTLAPEIIRPFDNYEAFGYQYCGGYRDDKGIFKGASNLDDLRQRLAPFLLRREIGDVVDQLPPVLEETVQVEIDFAAHPEVLEGQDEHYFELATARRIIGECKVDVALPYITDIMTNDGIEKIVLFAYHRDVIAGLKEGLSDFNPVVIAGGSTAKQKDAVVQRFKNDPSARVLIGQITASGEAVDGLQEVCSLAVFVEIDWVPGAMWQAVSRLHRIGQKGRVKVVYLVAGNSLEQIMVASLRRKGRNINNVIVSTHEENHMTIEQKLDRMIELLEVLVDGGSTPAETEKPKKEKKSEEKKSKDKKDKKSKDKKDKKPKVTFDDVREAASKFLNSDEVDEDEAEEQAIAIVKSFGAKKLAKLEKTPEHWEAVIAKFKEGPKPADDDDDDDDEDDDDE